jgi:uncharacterized membrane protein YfhO
MGLEMANETNPSPEMSVALRGVDAQIKDSMKKITVLRSDLLSGHFLVASCIPFFLNMTAPVPVVQRQTEQLIATLSQSVESVQQCFIDAFSLSLYLFPPAHFVIIFPLVFELIYFMARDCFWLRGSPRKETMGLKT